MYLISGNKGYITGNSGIYNTTITDPSVRYGRNAAANFQEYCDDFLYVSDDSVDRFEALMKNCMEMSEEDSLKELNNILDNTGKKTDIGRPNNFEYKYSPQTKTRQIDMMALMGVAFESLGKKISLSLQEAAKAIKLPAIISEKYNTSLEALDINDDKKIDISEYASYILLCDGRSYEDDGPFRADRFFPPEGMINQNGWENSTYFLGNGIVDGVKKFFSDLHGKYNLGEWQKKFVSNPNNMIDIDA